MSYAVGDYEERKLDGYLNLKLKFLTHQPTCNLDLENLCSQF